MAAAPRGLPTQRGLGSPVFGLLLALAGLLGAGCAKDSTRPAPAAFEPAATPRAERSTARPESNGARHWWIESPGGARFDASGLCLTPAGDLLVVADRGPQVYRIEFPEPGDTVRLSLVAGNPANAGPTLRGLAGSGRLDCEGLAADDQGRLYLCEESRRLVLRTLPGTGDAERMDLDWSAVARRFSAHDLNASFEGIAVGGGRLYLANERDPALILTLDLETGQLLESWVPKPRRQGLGPLHYSDLSWRDGRLFVLLRHQRAILECDPEQRTVVAQHDFGAIENARELRYRRKYPTGVMEGLAVGDDCFWLVSDNNGESRVAARGDRRPVLLRLPRPGGGSSQSSSPGLAR